jgi:protein-L-isoaspartate(D-aspartate) O-methyltransferase
MVALKAKPAQDRHGRDRNIMVAQHLATRGICDPLVLAAMGSVPREAFVPETVSAFAYEDSALPIEAGQTISQPYIVARMIELLELTPTDKVLEVGAGSGYAAAVLSRIAGKVYAIERYEMLADLARARLKRLGYTNTEIIHADGTMGWPEQAPYDAILVSAGGPKVPEALKLQLIICGRMVIPVGRDIHQTLLLVRRVGDDEFEEEEHGAVTFVPLIGEEGWREAEEAKRETAIDAETSGFAQGLLIPAQRARAIRSKLTHIIAEAAEPFGDLEELAALAERFAHKRVVLLGEATHGTSEFYNARAAITAMLVQAHGFNIVAVEADWPDAAVYDAFVRGLPRPKVPRAAFTRFPTWMWRNDEIASFLERLKAINEGIANPDRRCGFYGLDVYSLSASIEAVLNYLNKIDPECAQIARERYGCLTPWRSDPVRYGRMALSRGYALARSPSPTLCSISLRSGSIILPRAAKTSSAPNRMRASLRRRSNTTGQCITGTPSHGICVTNICSTRLSACSLIVDLAQRPLSGHITPISAMPSSPRWARCAASTISGSSRIIASTTKLL